MNTRHRLFEALIRLLYRWISPILDPRKFARGMIGYPWYLRSALRYRRMSKPENLRLIDTYPCIQDRSETHPITPDYFYQDVWGLRHIYNSRPREHVDIGSSIRFVGALTVFTRVKFVDIRPLTVQLENLQPVEGDITALPFADGSIVSISCLHVAEHIGLGRYGDELDPEGTARAAAELCRVLAKGGDLLFSVPVGRPRVCFNAHRVHSPRQIIAYFQDLELMEFSGVDDQGLFYLKADVSDFDNLSYGCGLFWFRKV